MDNRDHCWKCSSVKGASSENQQPLSSQPAERKEPGLDAAPEQASKQIEEIGASYTAAQQESIPSAPSPNLKTQTLTDIPQSPMPVYENPADLISKKIKITTHLLSIFTLPILSIILVLILSFSAQSGSQAPVLPSPFWIVILGIAAYMAFLYFLAGGFDWKTKKLQTIRIVFFWILGDFLLALFFYGFWSLIRWIIAKINGIPMQVMRGRMLATHERVYTGPVSKEIQAKNRKQAFLRWLPIITALVTLLIVAGVGIAWSAQDISRINSGKGIGAIALLFSVIVFFITKSAVNNGK
jgi:hypothetical protein